MLGSDFRAWMPPWPERVAESQRSNRGTSVPFCDADGVPVLRGWKLLGGTYRCLRFNDGVEFVVDQLGTEVWCVWPLTLTEEDATYLHLLGIVLGFMLRLRGTTCLHASAVVAEGRAIAFLGPECAGKSTLAAAFARRGYPVVTDDLVALSERDGTFHSQPGCPHGCLRPPSNEGLGDATGICPRLTPTWDNQYLDLDLTQEGYRFQQWPLPLAVVYILEERRDEPNLPFIEPVTGGQALIALLANTWATRMLDRDTRGREFAQLARLSARVPLRRVHPHADPHYLSKLCDVILNDYQAVLSSPSDNGTSG